MPTRAESFLYWMLKNFTIKKTSFVETYWHQLSQLYIKWTGDRMEPLLLKVYSVSRELAHSRQFTHHYQFINGPLAKEHELESTEADKPILKAEDLLEVCWRTWPGELGA